jgi:hypothetical protein
LISPYDSVFLIKLNVQKLNPPGFADYDDLFKEEEEEEEIEEEEKLEAMEKAEEALENLTKEDYIEGVVRRI